MKKFKVGQYVKITHEDVRGRECVGRVRSVHGDDDYSTYVVITKSERVWWLLPEDMEFITLSIVEK